MNLGGAVHLNKMGFLVLFFLFIIVALYVTREDEDIDSQTQKPRLVNIRQLLIASVELAEKGGVQVSEVRKIANLEVQSKGKTNEGANNPVTEADYKSHCVMYFGLKKAFPMLKVISEEEISEDKCGALASPRLSMQPTEEMESLIDEELPLRDLTVWIDPLDATQEFTENLLEYVTTLVCVAYKGRPLVGVIHRPFSLSDANKTSWAWIHRGLSQDLVSYKTSGQDSAVVISRSHSGPVEDIVHKALGEDTRIIRAGGAGYKVMQVVSGNASAYVHSTAIKKWDICAGDAVLTALGGTMTTLTNEEIDYSSMASPLNRDGVLATADKHQMYADKFHRALLREVDMHL